MNISESQYREAISEASQSSYLRGVEYGASRSNAKAEWRNGVIAGAVCSAILTAIIFFSSSK